MQDDGAPSPIKDMLYESINAISEAAIQRDLASNNSRKVILDILSRAWPDTLKGDRTENYETFAESLMHYILTNALIPSQRKITVDGVEIDIVIPDTRTLKTSNKDAVIILFPKTDDVASIRARLERIHAVQPVRENVWLVQREDLGLPYKTYEIEASKTFAGIIDDIKKSNKMQSKFKIFRV
ncbi:MAG: hypothetical protein LV468_03230 [Candidatus Nitrosotenuis sp.]|nr:hypothetical protein [Candidatus Nitrosotenuis sp.]